MDPGLIWQVFPSAELLSHRYLFSEFDPDAITRMLHQLTPMRVTTVLVSKAVEDEVLAKGLKEPWYGTRFLLEAIPQVGATPHPGP